MLSWPIHLPRTPTGRRQRSRFSQDRSWHAAARSIADEVRRLGGTKLNVSSNLETRNDGLPYANQRNPADPGVAVYFTLKDGRQETPVVMGCDLYQRCEDNLHAIALTIAAKRSILRYGVATGAAEFRGYAALPSGGQAKSPYAELGIPEGSTMAAAKVAYQELVLKVHPDKPGGDAERFLRVQHAFEQIRAMEQQVEA